MYHVKSKEFQHKSVHAAKLLNGFWMKKKF